MNDIIYIIKYIFSPICIIISLLFLIYSLKSVLKFKGKTFKDIIIFIIFNIETTLSYKVIISFIYITIIIILSNTFIKVILDTNDEIELYVDSRLPAYITKENPNDESELYLNIRPPEYIIKENSNINLKNINNSFYFSRIFEEHKVPSDNVKISKWKKKKDSDILKEKYNTGIKIKIYNNDNKPIKITSEIHFIIDKKKMNKIKKKKQRFTGKFVISKDMHESKSTAVISILLDGKKVYKSEELNCSSLSEDFDISLNKKEEMIIKIVCQYKGNPFIFGIVDI